MAKLVARLAVTAALWVRIQTCLKAVQNGRHRKLSGQHTLARQKKKHRSFDGKENFLFVKILSYSVCGYICAGLAPFQILLCFSDLKDHATPGSRVWGTSEYICITLKATAVHLYLKPTALEPPA